MTTQEPPIHNSTDQILDDEHLDLLMKLTGQINSNVDLDDMLLDIIKAVKLIMQSEASSLMLYDEDTDKLILSIPTGPATDEITGKHIPKDEGVGGWVFMNEEPAIVNDVDKDPRFGGDIEPDLFTTKNILCVPLLNHKKEIIGIIQALNKKGGQNFTADEIPMFQALANQAAIAIENARLHEQQKQKMLLEQKLDLARSIQSGFIPEEAPAISGYQIAGITQPATYVGGDYYDFISTNGDTSCTFALGDVTGKGVPASLLMASSRAVLRTQVENNHSLTKNTRICKSIPVQRYPH
ncbi:GAF domain-containing SpoIIE family protein phosphatase [Fodinibius sp. Rm-B-1B1-1]|uniref:GAF domain-containing SpoIIE family protein phosphatase n=1 Tax=Fodinibius alkaliphilus TaxID=3140241 RepID=UPI00315B2D14